MYLELCSVHNSLAPFLSFPYLHRPRPWSRDRMVQAESIADIVASIRNASSKPWSKFHWPVPGLSFQQAFTVALHHLLPGHYLALRNGDPIPDKLANWHLDYYHGTTVSALINNVLENGFKPSLGAGGEDMTKAWGFPVPLVYTSRLRNTAVHYPYAQELLPDLELVSMDGTLPLRVYTREIAIPERRVWCRKAGKNNQIAFMPDDMFITHVVFNTVTLSQGQLGLGSSSSLA